MCSRQQPQHWKRPPACIKFSRPSNRCQNQYNQIRATVRQSIDDVHIISLLRSTKAQQQRIKLAVESSSLQVDPQTMHRPRQNPKSLASQLSSCAQRQQCKSAAGALIANKCATPWHSVQQDVAYLKMGRHHSEVDELSRDPEFPVGYHCGLQIIAQLVLDLMTLTLQCMHCMKLHAPAALQPGQGNAWRCQRISCQVRSKRVERRARSCLGHNS